MSQTQEKLEQSFAIAAIPGGHYGTIDPALVFANGDLAIANHVEITEGDTWIKLVGIDPVTGLVTLVNLSAGEVTEIEGKAIHDHSIESPIGPPVTAFNDLGPWSWPFPPAWPEYWIQLLDTPGTIAPDQLVKGNPGGTALEFIPLSAVKEGITYAWADAPERIAKCTSGTMLDGELGIQRDTGDVYKYNDPPGSCSVFFNLQDGFFSGANQGDVLYRGAAAWQTLPAGTANRILKTQGPGADPIWELLQNLEPFGGGAAAQGEILYRGAASWQRLAPGIAGRLLETQGPGADPIWVAPPAGGKELAPTYVVGSADEGDTAADCDFLHQNNPGNPPTNDAILQACVALRDSGQDGLIYIRRGYYETETNNLHFSNTAKLVGEGQDNTVINLIEANPATANLQPWFCSFDAPGGGMEDLTVQVNSLAGSSPDYVILSQAPQNHFKRLKFQLLDNSVRIDNAIIQFVSDPSNSLVSNSIFDLTLGITATISMVHFVAADGVDCKHMKVEYCDFIARPDTIIPAFCVGMFLPPATTIEDVVITDNNITYPNNVSNRHCFNLVCNTSGAFLRGLKITNNQKTRGGGGFVKLLNATIYGLLIAGNDIYYDGLSLHSIYFEGGNQIEGCIANNSIRVNPDSTGSYSIPIYVNRRWENLRIINNAIDIGDIDRDMGLANVTSYMAGIVIRLASPSSTKLLIQGNQIFGSGNGQAGMIVYAPSTSSLNEIAIKDNLIKLTGNSGLQEAWQESGIFVFCGFQTKVEGNLVVYSSPYGAGIHLVGGNTSLSSSLFCSFSNNSVYLLADSPTVKGIQVSGQRSSAILPVTYYTDRAPNLFSCNGNVVAVTGIQAIPFQIPNVTGGAPNDLQGTFSGNTTNLFGKSQIGSLLKNANSFDGYGSMFADQNAAGVGIVAVNTWYRVAPGIGDGLLLNVDGPSTLLTPELQVKEFGVYRITYSASATLAAVPNQSIEHGIGINVSTPVLPPEILRRSVTRRRYQSAGDYGVVAGQSIFTLAPGDKISFCVQNITGGNDIIVRQLNVYVEKIN
jgi:hypothetical protein